MGSISYLGWISLSSINRIISCVYSKNKEVIEFTLEEKIKAIFNSGNHVKIEKVIRIKSDKTYYNYVWYVDGTTSRNWFGFDTLDECVEDCVTHLSIKNL